MRALTEQLGVLWNVQYAFLNVFSTIPTCTVLPGQNVEFGEERYANGDG